jgi:hypothetical protein
MKRGLITWNKSEIPPEVFERRVNRVRGVLAERDLPALVVFSDLWRSNQARFFANYMPYFNRALLIIPRDMPPTLLCGLSPRVYGWIRSVTTIEDVRPAGNFAKPLFDIAAERGWASIGFLDLEQFPYDLHKALHGGSLGLVNVDSSAMFSPADDDTEIEMRLMAARHASAILEEEIQHGIGLVDHEFVGRLERRFRRAGAEDLVILLTNGNTVPAPASGVKLEENFSVSIAVEFRGHWVRLSRAHGTVVTTAPSLVESLDGCYPYECGTGNIMAEHCEETMKNGKRVFYGNTIL